MKVGILTFHHSRNYGAVLQAYGLKEVIKSLGYDVETIDYRNPAIENRKSPFTLGKLLSNPLKFIKLFANNFYGYRKKVKSFACFEKTHLNITKTIYSPLDIRSSSFDLLVVGSDQVWSPIITNGPDTVYWGEYKPDNARIITYAASSCTTDKLETDAFNDVEVWLNRFSAISVREERLKLYVESHSNRTANVVLDPTLLAGRIVFEKITLPKLVKEPYILFYQVGNSHNSLSIVKKIAKLYHARILQIGMSSMSGLIKRKNDGITLVNASVEEMLSLVKYAECVVAHSFHGTALSLLYEKDFYTIRGDNMARVESVLSKCDLMDRIISSADIDGIEKINYNKINKVLEELRRQSVDWLNNAINMDVIK